MNKPHACILCWFISCFIALRLNHLLWPDSTDALAHTNLRQLVHRLRPTLPHADRFVCIEKQTLHWQLDTIWTLDVADFERAIAQAKAGAFTSVYLATLA